MTRCFAGVAAALIGLGLVIPALVAWREQGAMPLLGYTVLVPGVLLIASGIAAAIVALRAASAQRAGGRCDQCPVPWPARA